MTNSSDEDSKLLPDLKKAFVSREEFLKLVSVACAGCIALLASVPALAFVFNYLFLPRRRDWVQVGELDKFQTGETVNVVFVDPLSVPWDGVAARRTAWLRRTGDDSFIAFAVNCTHLGCPVRWEKGANLFMCPCHGGVFYANGNVAAGPPPRPMHQFPVRVNNGQVEISVGEVLTQG